jgi:hypothetical protein
LAMLIFDLLMGGVKFGNRLVFSTLKTIPVCF